MVANVLLLLVGVCAGAASIVFIKASTLHPILLAAYRQFAAALFLLPLFVREVKKEKTLASNQGFRGFAALFVPALLPGIALSLHFITWIWGARVTSSANATLVVNMSPIVMPFFSYLFLKETVKPMELLGTGLALGGLVLLGIFDFHLSRETLVGDMVCFAAMLMFSFYISLGRRSRNRVGLWTYLVPVYAVSGIFSFIVSLFFTNPGAGFDGHNLLMTLLLALVSTVAGHSIINYSARVFRLQTLSLINLSQFVFGAVFGWLFFGEAPKPVFYAASALITAGTVIVILFPGNKRT